MRWSHLLFAHWRVRAETLAPLLPSGVTLDRFDGDAWLGVVPFLMTGVRARCLPPLPRLSTFPELNLRTYVVAGGRPGVWFFSLDAAEPWAVRLARWSFRLPYLHAAMSCRPQPDGTVLYHSERRDPRGPPARLRVRYRGVGTADATRPGTLEHFLTARDCLFACDRRGLLRRGDIAHAPWLLRPATWEVEACEMTRIVGIDLPPSPPHLLCAEPVTVRAWLPVRF
jgi:uncharacterized protein YqjF (DUF2071 family)